MKTQEVRDILTKNPNASLDELVKLTKGTRSRDGLRKLRVKLGLPALKKTIQNTKKDAHVEVEKDRKVLHLTQSKKETDEKYRLLVEQVEDLSGQLDAMRSVKNETYYKIPKASDRTKSAVTAVVVASDWHWAETVHSENINGLNEFNLDIARRRAEKFFQNTVRLCGLVAKDSEVDTLVLALLGDFINGQLREEAMENNSLRPMDEMVAAWKVLAGGIKYILDNTKLNLVIPCHSGNHARVTRKIHWSTEAGNSLEYAMYHVLASEFTDNPRVKFIIPKSYHSYVDIQGFVIRFHHGHAIKYGGGVGGIFVPAFRAIAQWQKGRHADLDVFGHFHQSKDGGNFICNGSLIGFNEYAISIKADYERPRQTFFLVDHKRKEKTITTSVFLD